MQALPHHYAALGVPLEASPEELKLAWREAAQRWHPDALLKQGKTGQVRFLAAQEAFACLSDQGRRTTYDQAIQAQIDTHLGQLRSRPLAAFVGNFVKPRSQSLERGANRKLHIQLPLADVVLGCKRYITLPSETPCRQCDGIGCDEQGRPLVCRTCFGIGECFESGFIRTTWNECKTCLGRGFEPSQACRGCQGKGRLLIEKEWEIVIPAGQPDLSRLKVLRAGEPSEVGGEPGDLIVEIRHLSQPGMHLDGHDLHLTRTIPLWLALAGGPLRVQTPRGIARVHIPALSQDQTRLRLPEWGVRHAHGVGDGYLTLKVEWPTQLTAEAREEIQRWGNSLAPEVFPSASQEAQRLGTPEK